MFHIVQIYSLNFLKKLCENGELSFLFSIAQGIALLLLILGVIFMNIH